MTFAWLLRKSRVNLRSFWRPTAMWNDDTPPCSDMIRFGFAPMLNKKAASLYIRNFSFFKGSIPSRKVKHLSYLKSSLRTASKRLKSWFDESKSIFIRVDCFCFTYLLKFQNANVDPWIGKWDLRIRFNSHSLKILYYYMKNVLLKTVEVCYGYIYVIGCDEIEQIR